MAGENGSRVATLDDMNKEQDRRENGDRELWVEVSGIKDRFNSFDKKFTIGFVVLFLTSAGNLLQSSGLLTIILRAMVSGG